MTQQLHFLLVYVPQGYYNARSFLESMNVEGTALKSQSFYDNPWRIMRNYFFLSEREKSFKLLTSKFPGVQITRIELMSVTAHLNLWKFLSH